MAQSGVFIFCRNPPFVAIGFYFQFTPDEPKDGVSARPGETVYGDFRCDWDAVKLSIPMVDSAKRFCLTPAAVSCAAQEEIKLPESSRCRAHFETQKLDIIVFIIVLMSHRFSKYPVCFSIKIESEICWISGIQGFDQRPYLYAFLAVVP